jgi:hypothetical protein
MRNNTIAWFLSLFFIGAFNGFSQEVVAGAYGMGMKLAYDPSSHKLTGYFEDYTYGIEEPPRAPQFSCIFYLEGTVTGTSGTLHTSYPNDLEDVIVGRYELVSPNTFQLQLDSEHGGCWNVQHFVEAPVSFTLEHASKWIQIRYIVSDKAYFYSAPSKRKKKASYLVKNDFLCVEKITKEWAYGTFYGEKESKGWIRIGELNEL